MYINTSLSTQVVVPVNTFPNLKSKPLLAFSIVNILASAVVISLESYAFTYGQGIWAGCLILTTGILGCSAIKRPGREILSATLVLAGLSIAAAITSIALLGNLICIFGACNIWEGVKISHIVFDVISIVACIATIIITGQVVCSRQAPATVQPNPTTFIGQQWPHYQTNPQQTVFQQSHPSPFQQYPQQQHPQQQYPQQQYPQQQQSMFAQQPTTFTQQPSMFTR